MKCEAFFFFKSGQLVLALVLALVLISVPDYFSISEPRSIKFGLSSVTETGSVKSYSDFEYKCESLEVSENICKNLENLAKAGKVLLGLLCCDILLLSILAVLNLVQFYTIKRILANKQGQATKTQRKIIEFCFKLRLFGLVHPVIVNTGLGIYIKISHLEDFSKNIKMEAGIVAGIIQCFISLLGIAVFLWEISATKRRAARFLRTEKAQNPITKPKKLESCEINSEKSYDIEISV